MAVTFTNKAAGEMKKRLESKLGKDMAEKVYAKTFHSACVGILREYAMFVGFKRDFTIYDEKDCKSVLKDIYKANGIKEKELHKDDVLNHISIWKDKMITPDMAISQNTISSYNTVAHLYKEYQERLKNANAMDFDDLIGNTIQLLKEHPDIQAELQKKIQYIMVDEYQDVSEVQDLIFRAVSRDGNNLFFVGDVKQSIYRFRLADPTIFLDKYARFADFRAALPGAPRRILLRENFRSRRAVLEGANHVFSNIMSRALGELDYDDAARLRAGAPYPDDGEKPELAVLELPDADDDAPTPEKAALEADYVARRIRALIDGGASVWENGAERPAHYGDVVILLRSANSVGPVYRAALEAQGIPVSAETSGGFYTSEEVSVLCSLLAVVDNPHQDVPLIAALRSPLFGLTADDLAAVRK